MNLARAPESPQLANVEVLFELFRGPHGAVHLGRMLKGIDSGRLVTLREVDELDASARAAIDVARSVAHPQLLKTLGVVRSVTKQYLASEYVPGASLLELGSSVRASRFPLRPGVAVRIVKDALRAAEAAQRLLRDAASLGYARCLFTDTVWIADFGDVLLTDVNVAPLLAKSPPEADAGKAAAKDLLSAAIELFQLVSGEVLTAEVTSKLAAYVPAPLAEVLERAFALNDRVPFLSIGDFVSALQALPAELHADEQEVSEELKRRLGTLLTQRKSKLALLEVGATRQEDSEDVTRVFNASALRELSTPDTVRPDRGADEGADVSVPRPPRAASVESWQDMPTRVGHIGAAGAAFALRSDRPLQPSSVAPPSVAPPSSEAAMKPVSGPPSSRASAAPSAEAQRRARSLWWIVVALLATASAAWWATSTDTRSHRVEDPSHAR